MVMGSWSHPSRGHPAITQKSFSKVAQTTNKGRHMELAWELNITNSICVFPKCKFMQICLACVTSQDEWGKHGRCGGECPVGRANNQIPFKQESDLEWQLKSDLWSLKMDQSISSPVEIFWIRAKGEIRAARRQTYEKNANPLNLYFSPSGQPGLTPRHLASYRPQQRTWSRLKLAICLRKNLTCQFARGQRYKE